MIELLLNKVNTTCMRDLARRLDNAINWIILYPVDSEGGLADTCPTDSDLSVG